MINELISFATGIGRTVSSMIPTEQTYNNIQFSQEYTAYIETVRFNEEPSNIHQTYNVPEFKEIGGVLFNIN